jgi:hypothetical protein
MIRPSESRTALVFAPPFDVQDGERRKSVCCRIVQLYGPGLSDTERLRRIHLPRALLLDGRITPKPESCGKYISSRCQLPSRKYSAVAVGIKPVVCRQRQSVLHRQMPGNARSGAHSSPAAARPATPARQRHPRPERMSLRYRQVPSPKQLL